MSDQLDTKLNPSVSTQQNITKGGGVKKGFLISFVFTVALGAFQFGYSIGVFNTLQSDFQVLFQWTDDQKTRYSSIITSICSFGSACGALSIGQFLKYGKKKCILIANLLVIIGAGITLIRSVPAIIVGRFIYGVSSGAFSVLVPGFINELSPTEMKGPLGTLTQIFITAGIMIAFLLGLPIPDITNYDPTDVAKYDSFIYQGYWRIMFALPIFFSVLQSALLMTVFNYETPKFLKQNNQFALLNQLMGRLYESDRINERIQDIVVETGNQKATQSYKEIFYHPRYKYATLIGCSLSILQQLSGINAIMFYSSTIFQSAGVSGKTGTALTGIVNLTSTCFALPLLGRFGRKTLLWTMSFVMAALMIGYGIAYSYVDDGGKTVQVLLITLLLLFVCFFEFSLGPIVWIYCAEILTDKSLSVAILLNWVFTLLLAIIFPYILGTAAFIVFGGLCCVCGVFCLTLLKETRGLSEQEVAVLYSKEGASKYTNL